MKQLINFLSSRGLLLLAILSAGQLSAKAQETDEVCLTYSSRIENPQPGSGQILSRGTSGAGIELQPVQGLAGARIKAIEPCFIFDNKDQELSGMVCVWDSETRKVLYSQDADFKFGYNKIMLDTPFLIPDTPILIGVQLTLNEDTKVLGADAAGARFTGGRYVIFGTYIYDYTLYEGYSNWAMDVWIDPNGKDLSQNFPILDISSRNPYITAGGKAAITVKLQNLSTQKLTAAKWSVRGITADPVEGTTNGEMAKGAIAYLQTEVPVERTADMQFALTEINGNTVKNEMPAKLGVLYYSKSGMPKREHLIERWAGEWAPYIGKSIGETKDAQDFFEGTALKFNICQIHMHEGAYTTEDGEVFGMNAYGGLPSAKRSAPRLSLNRMTFGTDKTVTYSSEGRTTKLLDETDKNTYSFYDFKASLNKTDNPNELKATVDIQELEKIYFDDVVVTLSLLEDNVPVIDQIMAPDGYNHHQDIFIKTINGVNGTPLAFSNEKFSQTYDIVLPEPFSGNPDNFKVLVTIGRRPDAKSHICSKTILDSRILKVSNAGTTAIQDAENGFRPSVSVENGNIRIWGDYDKVEVFNSCGRQMTQTQLPDGLYLVKVYHEGTATIQKVLVKK
ncbi:MAG: T9SS type A sorting domain-containing protein [Prevotellaceae bacterium]|nr:T9SS type A sorting domain-containing protein [Prevotella sp.]MDD7258020.1 T9SS type A sorting domain-containing protein [Prevotellaceae bacterium]MDY6130526.1 T9SS type A sorting domain-containing protein [Prevotella sp.]